MGTKSDVVAMVTLMAVLAVTSLSLFAWIASTGWTDQTGIAVAVIFILLTAVQSISGLVWWKVTHRSSHRDIDAQKTEGLMKELTDINPQV